MKYSLSTKHVDLSEEDRTMMEAKLGRLDKYLLTPFVVDVLVSHDTHHRHGNVVTCRINIEQRGAVLHAERVSDTVQGALDEVIEALRQELDKQKAKELKRRRANQ